MNPAELGTIYGVGVGPGDPRMLTLRAVEVLHTVAAVLVPCAAEDRESLALSIARPHLPETCQVLEAVFPMTERREVLEAAWNEAAEKLLAVAATGKAVAFLTLGDAMLYSTWSYLLKAIQARCPAAPVETVPGITAMSACAAATGDPLAEGRAPLLVWPDTPPANLDALLAVAPNIVFMKTARHLDTLASAAEAAGAEVTAVRRCSLPTQQITTDPREWASERDYFTTALLHGRGAIDHTPTAAHAASITFVGAGPGDPELVTVKGQRALREADVVLYAGSLVPTTLLRWTKPGAECHDSAGMHLDAQIALMAQAVAAGKTVVRLHTGDPSIYGAIGEQMAELDKLGIAYRVIPGVSSFLASAAALPTELTLPGVSQTVIITRCAGRTPVPEGQEIAGLAAHQATMAIFLSAGRLEETIADLCQHYPPTTPAAIVQRASWPEQKILRGTLATMAQQAAAEGIDRTAMILVGDVLANEGEPSKLYDKTFAHGYRAAGE